MNIGIIGCGNMGQILLESLLSDKIKDIDKIFISDKDQAKLEIIKKKYNINTSTNKDLVKVSDVVIIAVKPQDIQLLLNEISDKINNSKLIISIVAGVKIAYIESFFDRYIPVIRIMPNIACLVKEGISAVSMGSYTEDKDLKLTELIFSRLGEVISIDESLMDVVTVISGSGPGYLSFIIDNIISETILHGIEEDLAKKLILKTCIGTVKILEKTDFTPKELMNKVASKGGTTEAALNIFKEKKMDDILRNAIKSAISRSKDLSEK